MSPRMPTAPSALPRIARLRLDADVPGGSGLLHTMQPGGPAAPGLQRPLR
jgi:hypothetical protein